MLGEMAHDGAAELAAVELAGTTLGKLLQRPRQIGHDDPLAGRDAAVLPVDRPPVRGVAKDQIENRVQVGLRRRELDALPGKRDRRLDQPAPGKRCVPLVRGFQPCDRAGHGAGARADEEDLRRGAVEVDVDRLHVRLGRLGGAASRQRDEEVEEPIGSVPCPVHEQEAARSRAGQRALGHPRGEGGGQTGVDGVSAFRKDLGTGLGGEPVPGGDRSSHRRQG